MTEASLRLFSVVVTEPPDDSDKHNTFGISTLSSKPILGNERTDAEVPANNQGFDKTD